MTLPIVAIRETFVESLHRNRVTIIEAETGAGKSTYLPQYALEAGFNCVVTQPRRIAVRSVAARIAELWGEELGLTIGFRTGENRLDSHQTRCLLCTDGLALIRELMGQNDYFDTLFIDEVHEWNLNIEVLVAWVKYALARGEQFKVVIQSATLEGNKLSKFFGNAPAIKVEGRLFPITEQPKGKSIAADIVRLVRESRDILVFLPGKGDIGRMTKELGRYNLDAEILPLHGGLQVSEQDLCFASYGRPKVILATNIAQTSITVEGIDAVIDSGLEKRILIVDGVEGLYKCVISKADSEQRKGRAGRTRPGIYINHCPKGSQTDFPIPEIQRCNLEMAYLRLKLVGVAMEKFEFFHDPGKEAILRSKNNLYALGCLTKDGEVTEIGEKVSFLPLSPSIGRMVVEGERLGVLDDIITIAAIIEAGGIVSNRNDLWRVFVTHERDSDLLAQLELFKLAINSSESDYGLPGLDFKKFGLACDISEKIRSKAFDSEEITSTRCRESILKSICAGMVNNLYRFNGSAISNELSERELSKESVVDCDNETSWLVGIPFDVETDGKKGSRIRKLLNLVTKIDSRWLLEIAPELAANVARSKPRYDLERDCVISTRKIFFNKVAVEKEDFDDSESSQAPNIFAGWIASQIV